jgi:Lsr2
LARHEIIEVSCDICGAVIDTAVIKPDRNFAIEGQLYRIDLCVTHTNEFDNAVAQFVAHARSGSAARSRTTARRRTTRSGARSSGPSEIRTWARANGFPNVSDRGRVPREILTAFQAAQGAPAAASPVRTRAIRAPRKAAPAGKRASTRRASAAKKAAAGNGG